ncbi:hypothetical protein D1872_314670 [compost metagenome]
MQFAEFILLLVEVDLLLKQLAGNILLAITQCCFSLALTFSSHSVRFLQTLLHATLTSHLLRYCDLCLMNFRFHITQILVQHHNWVFYFIQNIIHRCSSHILHSFKDSHN